MTLNKRVRTVLQIVAGILGVVVVALAALSIYLFSLSQTLPDLRVDGAQLRTPRTSVVYAADGTPIAQWHGDQDRTVVALDTTPEFLRDAVVAVEDRRFYEHNGVDIEAIGRALRANATAGKVREGGSTITQQLVKILFTDGDRTLTRKVREALLAFEFETKADKDQVLETYLNTVYFGNGAYGVESAARHYFGKGASTLTLPEAAMLAGVIRSPVGYDPFRAPVEAKKRRNLVLSLMAEQGYISQDAAHEAQASDVALAPPTDVPPVAPYFVEYVKQDLIDRLGADRVYNGGLRVYTSLELPAQKMAEQAAGQLQRDDPEAAVVAIRHSTGRVIAMVGGRDFASNQFNLAAQGRRQPGSAFKPFVLVTALEQGVRPQDVYSAAPFSVPVKDGVWNVENYENTVTHGSMTLQAATSWSVNAVYARLITKVGPDKVAKTARRLGILSPVNADPAIALGGLTTGVSPLEMASAYGTIANGGVYVAPSGIEKVTTDTGAVVYEPELSRQRVLDEAIAAESSLMLHDVVEHGTGSAARIGTWAAGKTGTTQSYRDAWFVGWAGDISTAVWVGYPQGQIDMTNVHGIKVTGGSYPAKIWAQFMKGAMALGTPQAATADSDVSGQVVVRVCPESMQLANPRCPDPVEIYLDPSRVPKHSCEVH